MTTLIHTYEQQYSVLTAEITAKIGRLKTGIDDDREQLCGEIQNGFEEANELLEQLELECRGAGAGGRAAAYRAELARVTHEYKTVVSPTANFDIEDASDEWDVEGGQRRALLPGSRVDAGTGRLREARGALEEARGAGAGVLRDLHQQRETIARATARLRETDATLGRGSRLLSGMLRRALQDRLALYGLAAVLAALLCVGLYLYVT